MLFWIAYERPEADGGGVCHTLFLTARPSSSSVSQTVDQQLAEEDSGGVPQTLFLTANPFSNTFRRPESQISSQKKKTGVVSPKRFIQRLKRDREQFRSYDEHQVPPFCVQAPKTADLPPLRTSIALSL